MVVFRGSTSAGLTTPFPGLAQQSTLSLGGLQEIGFVGFRNADKGLSLNGFRGGKEAMAPAKRRALRNAKAIRSPIERKPVSHRASLREPFAAQVQSGQRGTGQGVERLAAAAALVTLQSVGMAISDGAVAAAMWAARPPRQEPFYNIHRCHPVLRCRQFRRHNSPLMRVRPPSMPISFANSRFRISLSWIHRRTGAA
jgi:hypothetical protein